MHGTKWICRQFRKGGNKLVNPSTVIDEMPIWVVDNYLPAHDHEAVYLYCQNSLYTTKHSSSPNAELHHPRMVANLTNEQLMSFVLTNHFINTSIELGYNVDIERAYINLATKDTVCTKHTDGSQIGLSMLYYPNTDWDIDWGGETLFFNQEKEIAFASLCKPNRAVFFDPRILHTARPPTTLANAFRYTIAYKSWGKIVQR